MKKFVSQLRSNSAVNLILLSLVHFSLILISSRLLANLPDSIANISNLIGMLLVTLLFFFSYLAFILRNDSEENLFELGWLFVLVAAGMVFVMGRKIDYLFIIAMSQWGLYKSTFKIIFKGETGFMKKFSRFILIISFAVWSLLLLVPFDLSFKDGIVQIYNLYYGLLTETPFLVAIFYYKHIKKLFNHQKIELGLLIVLHFVVPALDTWIYMELPSMSTLSISNYTQPFFIMAIIQWRLLYNIIKRKLSLVQTRLLGALAIIGLGLLAAVLVMGLVVSWRVEPLYALVNILVWAFGFSVTIIKSLTNSNTDEEVSLLKPVSAIRLVVNDERESQEFSDFLHNQVLQGIVVIKNLNEYSDQIDVKDQIDKSSDDLIKTIRDRLDYYNSDYSNNLSARENYTNLVQTVQDRLKTDIKINLTMNINANDLLDPYGRLVYRIIEELLTNAIKHTTGDKIDLSLVMEGDKLVISCQNEFQEKLNQDKAKSGKGQKLLEAKVQLLSGQYKVTKDNNQHQTTIKIPIDKELINEYFINR